MANTSALDLEGVMAFGLFSADGRHLAGNLAELPPDIAADGRVRLLAHGVRRIDRLAVQRARALSLRLDNGQLLVLARSEEHRSELQSLMRISYAVFCLTKQTTTTPFHYIKMTNRNKYSDTVIT